MGYAAQFNSQLERPRRQIAVILRMMLLLAVGGCVSMPEPPPAQPGGSKYGRYVGRVVASWNDDGRRMTLMEPYAYYDPNGLRWDAPLGAEIDGASIPKQAWSLIGGPYEGLYRFASVIHDVACDEKIRPWEDVHLTFYYGMRASGVEEVRAKMMWVAVHEFGPRWPRYVHVTGESADKVNESVARLQSTLAASGESLGETLKASPWTTVIPYRGAHTRIDGRGQEVPLPGAPRVIGFHEIIQEVLPPPRRMTDEELAELLAFIQRTNPTLDEIRKETRRLTRVSPFTIQQLPTPPKDPFQHPFLRDGFGELPPPIR